MLRGLSAAQAWPASDSVTLGHWHATEPQGRCSWDLAAPGVAARVLARAACSCPEAVFVHKREMFLQDHAASPIPTTPLPASFSRCRTAPPPVSHLPAPLLTAVAGC